MVEVYGGPNVGQSVVRRWGGLEDQLMVGEGYVVFKLDNRGTPNRGAAFKTAIYHHLGRVEVEDQIAGVNFLKTLPYVDPSRIAIAGWSYGGFMTLSLLTAKDSPFAVGLAGAPPTNWKLYDTHYTEQFMGTPQENPDGYAESDVVSKLDAVKPGTLLLMQGMADDNVIFENSTRVMAALQAKGIPFELMDYPGERHGIHGNAEEAAPVAHAHRVPEPQAEAGGVTPGAASRRALMPSPEGDRIVPPSRSLEYAALATGEDLPGDRPVPDDRHADGAIRSAAVVEDEIPTGRIGQAPSSQRLDALPGHGSRRCCRES